MKIKVTLLKETEYICGHTDNSLCYHLLKNCGNQFISTLSFHFYTNSTSKVMVERRVRPGLCLSPESGRASFFFLFRFHGDLFFMI